MNAALDATRNALTWSDEADLSWFFSVGQSTFERSTFGDCLERAEQFGSDEDGNRIEHPSEQERRAWQFHRLRCWHPEPVSIDKQIARELEALIDWEELDPSLTVQPSSGRAGEEPSYVPDDYALRRYAVVSRALALVPRVHFRALSGYFGLRGEHFGMRDCGRVMVLYGETRAGKMLLGKFADRHRDRRHDEILEHLWEQQRSWKDFERGRLLQLAEEQALGLLERSKRSYAGARGAR